LYIILTITTIKP